jgi:Mg2+/citrate symporter
MGFETLIGIAAAVIAAIAGAFGLGHIRGTSKAEAKADQQRTEEKQRRPLRRQNVKRKSRKRPAMYSRLLITCLMTMLIASCVTRGSAAHKGEHEEDNRPNR